jgi:hypothetical protein
MNDVEISEPPAIDTLAEEKSLASLPRRKVKNRTLEKQRVRHPV